MSRSDEFAPNIVYSVTGFKPSGHRLMGSNKDDDWLVYADSEPNNKNYYTCFLWNHILKAKVHLPCLPDAPESFFKCVVVGCSTFLSNANLIVDDCCRYRVYLFYKNDPIYICSSVYFDGWNKIQYSKNSVNMWLDVVSVESSSGVDMPETICSVARLGFLYFETSKIMINSQNSYYMNGDRRLVVSYGEEKNRLFLLERKLQCAWEVWEVDYSNQSLVRVFDLEGIVVFLSQNYSVAYFHRQNSGLNGNCICFTEEGDDDNIFVFWLADQTLSVFKNQSHSGFPFWFHTSDLRMPRFSFVEEDVHKGAAQEPMEKADEIMPMYPDKRNASLSLYSELPGDLQELVTKSLHSALDIANFRLACRKWKDITRPICWKSDFSNPSTVKIPWLMSFQENDSSLSIIDPTDNMTYYKNTPELLGCRIRYSKDGWLLVTRGLCTIFFFEPFSKTKINVVDIPDDCIPPDCIMSFSSSPTLSKWAIIGIVNSPTSLIINYLRSDDKEWDYSVYEVDEEASLFGCSLVSHGDMFFYLYPNGNLGVIHWKDSILEFYISVVDGSTFGLLSNHRKGYLVPCKNDLYGVVMGPLGKYVNVYKLDTTASIWNEVKTVGNFSFFVSQTSSIVVPIMERAEQNTINFPLLVENRHLSYKLDTSEFRYYKDDKICRDFKQRKELLCALWLQPRVCQKYR